MVTGKAFSSGIDEAMALDANGHMTKPIAFKKLVRRIKGSET